MATRSRSRSSSRERFSLSRLLLALGFLGSLYYFYLLCSRPSGSGLLSSRNRNRNQFREGREPPYILKGREGMIRHPEQKYFLTAVIFNRVFAEDKFNISIAECTQWLEYLRYAGVDHVYWYDTAKTEAESQETDLQPYVDSGFLTYHRWQRLFPGREDAKYNEEQDRSYDHCVTTYGTLSRWMLECDVDEYPFNVGDSKTGFMARTLRNVESREPKVSQWLMQCLIFVGNGDPSKKILIERYQRRRTKSEGTRANSAWAHKMKPIFKPSQWAAMMDHDPHKVHMDSGETMVFAEDELRINHYWGGRVNDWGPDRPEVLNSSVVDSSIQPIVEHLRSVLSPRHGGDPRQEQQQRRLLSQSSQGYRETRDSEARSGGRTTQ